VSHVSLTAPLPVPGVREAVVSRRCIKHVKVMLATCLPCRAASLTVTSCFYHDLLLAEGVPELAAACCCGVDRVW
jgi:hypothetical protein